MLDSGGVCAWADRLARGGAPLRCTRRASDRRRRWVQVAASLFALAISIAFTASPSAAAASSPHAPRVKSSCAGASERRASCVNRLLGSISVTAPSLDAIQRS